MNRILKEKIKNALISTNTISAAAEKAGVSRATIYRLLKDDEKLRAEYELIETKDRIERLQHELNALYIVLMRFIHAAEEKPWQRESVAEDLTRYLQAGRDHDSH